MKTGYPGMRLVLRNEPGSPLAMDSYVAESPNRSSRGPFATYATSTAEAMPSGAMTWRNQVETGTNDAGSIA
jgi:hypothetical protein